MFSAGLKIKGGMDRWLGGLGSLLRRKGKEVTNQVNARHARPEPRTEGEKSLYHAMNWVEDGWEDAVEDAVSDSLR